jgi:Holliday junction resolvase-like predicted endonuclease
VDIIAEMNGRLHFFEIKTRTTDKYGKPEESMSHKKMKMLKTALKNINIKTRNGNIAVRCACDYNCLWSAERIFFN